MNQARMAIPPATSLPSVRREAARRPGALDLGANGSGRRPRRWPGSVLKPWPHAGTFNLILRGIESAGGLRSSWPGQRVSLPGSSPIEQRFATPRKGGSSGQSLSDLRRLLIDPCETQQRWDAIDLVNERPPRGRGHAAVVSPARAPASACPERQAESRRCFN